MKENYVYSFVPPYSQRLMIFLSFSGFCVFFLVVSYTRTLILTSLILRQRVLRLFAMIIFHKVFISPMHENIQLKWVSQLKHQGKQGMGELENKHINVNESWKKKFRISILLKCVNFNCPNIFFMSWNVFEFLKMLTEVQNRLFSWTFYYYYFILFYMMGWRCF
jgi:hypothetical protein